MLRLEPPFLRSMLISGLSLVPTIAMVFDPHRVNDNLVYSQYEFRYDELDTIIPHLVQLIKLCGMKEEDLMDELLYYVVAEMGDTSET
jgi:hypothetical protein